MTANGYGFTDERFSGDNYGSGRRLDMDYGLEFTEFVEFTPIKRSGRASSARIEATGQWCVNGCYTYSELSRLRSCESVVESQ